MAKRKVKQKKAPKKKAKEEIKEIEEEVGIKTEEEVEEAKAKKETVILGHFKPRFFLILGVIIVLGIGLFYFFGSQSQKSLNPSTAVFQCISNNQCVSGQYCTNYGACVQDTCGDGVCTAQKLQSGSCPLDCGCPSGQVLNKYSGSCQAPLNITNAAVANVVNSYLKRYNITGTITGINNTYYGNQTVKVAYVNCQSSGSKYPCQMVFYVNNNAQIVNTTRTS